MQPPFPRPRSIVAQAVVFLAAQPGHAQNVAQAEPDNVLPPVTVIGNYSNGIGSSEASSAGVVTRKLIESRLTLRPAEILEFVPGLIVSQHSGDGKANQYYLRGFNLDHGTDFATFVDGMPVNMPTHAHGHGYTDLNWLIPELVDRINYRKGPYYADEGDFASAGSARIRLVDTLSKGQASLTLGANSYARALMANSTALKSGNLLYAIEAAYNNGPWDNAEHFKRFNGVLRYSLNEGGVRQSLTAMAYTAKWDATDQVPQRAIDQGLIGRFGAIDASDHGNTQRTSLSYHRIQALNDGDWLFNAYALTSRLNLFSNFTYYLDDPVHGDQFEQAERRQTYGAQAARSWSVGWGGLEITNKVGAQFRHDRLSPVGLYSAQEGARRGGTQESRVSESNVGVYVENDTSWLPWLRSVAGLRSDRFDFEVNSSIEANSGSRHATINSPKLSLIFGPWNKTEYFINSGWGFHSNDARGVTATASPKEGTPIDPAPALVRTRGSEIGARTEIIPGLQSSLSLWQLSLNSELVFSGDAGDTEASGASHRYGIEFNHHYVANDWLLLDGDLAFSQARFDQAQGDEPNVGRYVPGSVRTVVSLGATVTNWGPWFGQFQLRYFGPRPLIEDNSVRSQGTTLAYLRAGYKLNASTKVSLDIFNLFNRKASDIDYYYVSRLQGEPTDGVGDIHRHPAEPRTARVTMTVNF